MVFLGLLVFGVSFPLGASVIQGADLWFCTSHSEKCYWIQTESSAYPGRNLGGLYFENAVLRVIENDEITEEIKANFIQVGEASKFILLKGVQNKDVNEIYFDLLADQVLKL